MNFPPFLRCVRAVASGSLVLLALFAGSLTSTMHGQPTGGRASGSGPSVNGGVAKEAPGAAVLFNGHAVAPGQYIGRLKGKAPIDAKSLGVLAAQVPTSVGIEAVESLKTRRLTVLKPKAAAAALLKAANDVERQKKIKADLAALMATGLYDYVEPDYTQYACAVSSDSAFVDGKLWGLFNSGQEGGVSGADIDAASAWDITTGSTDVIVGVIDTGIRYTHQDLVTQMWTNLAEIPGDGIDNDNNGYVDDVHGINAITGSGDPMDDHNHGTHCSGTIGASANDGGPIVGVAWKVRLMGLKFLDAGGSGNTSDAVKCINYALSKGVRILSNSWAGGGYSQALFDAIAAARDQGCLFVAAAANWGTNTDRFTNSPSCYELDNIVSVAALDRSDNLAGFSNFGLMTVDLGAPGVAVYSSVATSDAAYDWFSGTSMATPYVAGVAALVLAQYPGISVAELKQRLVGSSREVDALRGKSRSGGALSAYSALTISADGTIEVRYSAAVLPLRAGHEESLFLTVSDLAPVTGALVSGTFAGTGVTFRDDGVAPDRSANDGVYSGWGTVPEGVTGASLEVEISAAGKSPYSGSFLFPVANAPQNDDFAKATVIPPGVLTVNGDNTNAGEEQGEPIHGGFGSGHSVWWSWISPSDGVVAIDASEGALLGVYTGASVSALTSVDQSGEWDSAVFIASVGTTYRIAVDSFGRNSVAYVLNLPASGVPLPTNDTLAAAAALVGESGSVDSTNLGTTKETGEPAHAGVVGGHSVWWNWTAPRSGLFAFSTLGSGFDTVLAAYTGSAVDVLTAVSSNDNGPDGDSSSEVVFDAVAGTTYRIVVDGSGGSVGLIHLSFRAVAPPSIGVQPLSAVGVLGGSAAFSVVVSGELPVCQWFHDGRLVSGASATTLALTDLVREDGGDYYVVVSNRFGRVPSNVVQLSGANLPPVIQPPPSTVSAVSGGRVQLTVAAAGPGALTYQWRHLGVAIPGATAALLTIDPVLMADEGLYDVVVYDGLSRSISSATRLMVGPFKGDADCLRLDTAFAPFVEAGWAEVASLAVGPSGAVYAGGNFSTIAGQRRHRVARFSATLEIDATFVPVIDGTVSGVVAQPDGKILVCGDFSHINGVLQRRIARLNADGSLDSSFVSGFGDSDVISAIIRQSDGRIVVGGWFSAVSGAARPMVARLNTDGTLDGAFGSASGPNSTVSSLCLQSDGKVLVGGYFTTVAGQSLNGFARLNTDGTLDSSYTVGTGFAGGGVGSIITQPDGRILVGGQFTSYNGVSANRLVRLGTDGAIDPSFAIGAGFDGEVRAVAVLTDGRIAASGWFASVNGTSQSRIAVLASDGSLDTGFATGARPNGPGYALISMADGGVLEGGYFNAVGTTGVSGVVRFSATGTVVAATAAGFRRPGQVQAAVPVSGGKWVIGGYFSAIDGVACSNLARLNADGTLDPTFDSVNGPDGSVGALAVQGDDKVLAGGGFYSSHGLARRSIARFNTDGSLDPSFNPGMGFNSAVTALALQADGKVVAGGWFTTLNGVTSNRIARLNIDGSLDATFASGTGLSDAVRAIVVEPNGRIIVGGQFASFDGASVNYIVGLLPTGARDSTFASGSGFSGVVENLALRSDGTLMATGGFSSYNGTSCGAVAHMLEGGSLDPAFSVGDGPNSTPLQVLLPQVDGRTVVGGYFTTFSGATKRYLTRLQANGALDASFGAFDLTSGVWGDARLMDDGGLLVLDSNAERGGASRSGLLRLKPDVSPAAAITVQPTNQATTAGGSATFSVSATGEDLHFQWFQNGVAIGSATSDSLALTNVQLADVADYTVRVSNSYGSVLSSSVTITGTAPAPTITTQPGVVTATSGTEASFSVGATGTTPLSYQWRRLGVPITGATNATLTLSGVTMADAGFYDVIVYDGLTPATSLAGRLVVTPAGGYADTLRLDTAFAPFIEADWAEISSVAVAPDGAVYAVGNFSTIAGQRRQRVARFSAALELDAAFVPVIDGTISGVVAQPDGKIVVCGDFSHVNGVLQRRIARLNADGSLDSSFVSGFGDSDGINAILRQSDGLIVVGGWFSAVGGVARPMVARLNTDGTLDGTFGSDAGPNGTVSSLCRQSDGKILVGGYFTTIGGQSRNGFARLNADGTLDSLLTVGTGFAGGDVRTITVQSDGSILVGGSFTSYNEAPANRLVRLNTDGMIDPSFAIGNGFDSGVRAVAVLADGRIAVSGWFSSVNGTYQYGIAVLASDGVLDTGFGSGARPNGPGYALIPTADGGLLEGGYFTAVGSACSGLVRLSNTGTVVAATAAGFRRPGWVYAAEPVAGGKWVIGGYFSSIEGVPCANLARLNADGTVDPTFASVNGPNSTVTALAVQGDGKVVAGGGFYSSHGLPRRSIARYNADGSLDVSFDPGAGFNSEVTTLAFQADGKVVAGGWFTTFDGVARNRIARLNANGSLDATFAPGTGLDNGARTVVVEPNGRIVVGGYFTLFDGVLANSIVGLLPTGARDSSFSSGSGFAGSVEKLALRSDDSLMAAGNFSSYNGTDGRAVAHLLEDGSLDLSFSVGDGPNSTPLQALLPQADDRTVVAGHFSMFSGATKRYLTRLQANGALDASFGAFDLTSGVGGGARLMDDGGLLVLNASAERGGVSCSGLLRLKPDVSPAAAITVQPTTQATTAGGSATFSVTATGDDVQFQWFRNGVAIDGASSDSLTLTNVQLADVADYTVTVSNSYGSVLSSSVTITGTAPAPTISTQPGVTTATSGTNATFTVAANGTTTLTYQWRRLGVPIAGATSTTLTLKGVTMADSGFYDVIVYDGLTLATSQAGRLVVTAVGGYADTLRLDTAFAPFIEADGAEVSSVSVAPDGAVYAVGSFSTIAGQRRRGVARFNAAMELDPTFAPVVDGRVSVVLAEADGGALVGGSFTSVNGVARSGFARLNPDGTLDSSFVPAVTAGYIGTLVRQNDGRVLAGGWLQSVASGKWGPLARLEANGALDASFAIDTGINNTVTSIAMQADGKILVGGYFSSVGGLSRYRLARLNADGTIDSSFTVGTGFNSDVGSITTYPGGSILVGGSFTSYNGTPANRLVRLNTDGTIDPSFAIGTGFNGEVRAVAVMADGRIAVSGWFNSVNGSSQSRIAVLASDGTLDTGFATVARPNGAGYSLISMADGGLIEGGYFNAVGSPCSGLVRFSHTGAVVAATVAGFRQPGWVYAAEPVADGKWVIGGAFSAIDGVACSNLARLNVDGTVDLAFASANGPDLTVQTLAVQGDGKVLAGGWFYSSHGLPRRSIARYNADGSLDASFNPGTGFNSGVPTLVLQADGKVVAGGSFTTFDGVAQNRIARLNVNGTLDATFASGAGLDNDANALVVEPNGRIVVGGYFNWFDGVSANSIVGLLPTGARDSSFSSGSGFTGSVEKLALCSDDSLMAAGNFSSYNGTDSRAVAQLLEDGSLDLSFSVGGGPNSTPLRALMPQADGRTVVGGYFTAFAGVEKRYLARLGADGALDTSFAAFDLTGPVAVGVRLMDDGGLLVLNSSAVRGGFSRSGLLRLKPDVSPVPVIVAQPASTTVSFGSGAGLSVSAIGAGPLSYQWYRGESGDTTTPIDGATGDLYSTPALTAWGRYWVRVSIGSVGVDSGTALVQVEGGTMTLADWTSLPGVPSAQREALDAPAGDSVSNLMKFALGVPPMDDALGHLPTPVVRQLPGQSQGIGLSFPRNLGAQGIELVLEISADLHAWSPVDYLEEPIRVNADGTVQVRLWEVNPPNVPRRFARLRVDAVPSP